MGHREGHMGAQLAGCDLQPGRRLARQQVLRKGWAYSLVAVTCRQGKGLSQPAVTCAGRLHTGTCRRAQRLKCESDRLAAVQERRLLWWSRGEAKQGTAGTCAVMPTVKGKPKVLQAHVLPLLV